MNDKIKQHKSIAKELLIAKGLSQYNTSPKTTLRKIEKQLCTIQSMLDDMYHNDITYKEFEENGHVYYLVT